MSRTKSKIEMESFTLMVPKEWREIAQSKCDDDENLNFGLIVRQAIKQHYKKLGWLEK